MEGTRTTPAPCALPDCSTSTRARLIVAGFPHPVPLCSRHYRPAVESWQSRVRDANKRNRNYVKFALAPVYTVENVAGGWLDALGVPVGSLGPESIR